MKFKCFVFLICLLLFVAAVDTIPDPPAVSPRSGEGSGISPLHFHGSFNLPGKERPTAAISIRHSQVACFAFRLEFLSESADDCPLVLVRQAADSSPPLLS